MSQLSRASLLILYAICFGGFACKRSASKLAADTASNQEVDMETEFEPIDLPGPVANLLSLSFGTPVFMDKMPTEKRTELRLLQGFKSPNPISLAIDTMISDSRLKEGLQPEYAGELSVSVRGDVCEKLPCNPNDPNKPQLSASNSFMRKFFGYCLNDKVFALQAFSTIEGQDPAILQEDATDPLSLRLLGMMPTSYRQDIKGCKSRFRELLNVKVVNEQHQQTFSQEIETINFGFSFIPGYSGADNYRQGNKVLGVAEIVADIATLGLGTKFKAGWMMLGVAEDFLPKIHNGLATAAVVANTVRLGTVMLQIKSRGAQVSDIPTLVLLTTETGFLIARIKFKPRQNVNNGVVDAVIDASAAIKNIGGKKFVNLSKILPNFKDEILIGFDGGHAFLLVGGRRVEGGVISFLKAKSAINDISKSGVFAHLKGLDPELKANIFKSVKELGFSPSITCANSVCRILKNEGNIVVGNGRLVENFTPSQLLNQILEGNIVQKTSGQNLSNLKIDIYVGKNTTVENFLSDSAMRESAMVGGLIAVGLGVVTFAYEDQSQTEPFILATPNE